MLTPDQRQQLILKRQVFKHWQKTAVLSPIIDDLKGNSTPLLLDNSPIVPDFGNIFSQPFILENYVNRQITGAGVKYAVGGYNEKRKVYQAEQYLTSGPVRDVHLGYDVWGPAGTPLQTPLNSKVHSFAYDPAEGSYGATIILEHAPSPELTFYTLYGHLSRTLLRGIKKAMPLLAGQTFAALGERKDNGNWPPHLHFQVVLDMLDYEGDFPGVFSKASLTDGQLLCPDPSVFLGDR